MKGFQLTLVTLSLIGILALLIPQTTCIRPAERVAREQQWSRVARHLTQANNPDSDDEAESSDDDDDDDTPKAGACDHCLRVDFYELGKSCNCMFDCCRPFHYDEDVEFEKLPLACRHYYYSTEQWKTCQDPCAYCTKSEYLGVDGQDSCFESCCAVEKDDVTEAEAILSYRVSTSCHDWQQTLLQARK
jgi:hypothetical protein